MVRKEFGGNYDRQTLNITIVQDRTATESETPWEDN